MTTDYIPFCGVPPLPADLLGRWTLDPVLLVGLAVALIAGVRLSDAARRGTFIGGWTVAALLFASPICALSMALFSARVAQHLGLVLVAAPLIAAAFPARRTLPPAAAAALFAALFWLWHLPGPYAATLSSDPAYWLMHLSLLGSAVLLWAALARIVQERPFAVFLSLAATAAQMTALGLALVFSADAWHGWHALTAAPYGLTALADQHLAGMAMWATGGVLMLGGIGWLAARFLAPEAKTG